MPRVLTTHVSEERLVAKLDDARIYDAIELLDSYMVLQKLSRSSIFSDSIDSKRSSIKFRNQSFVLVDPETDVDDYESSFEHEISHNNILSPYSGSVILSSATFVNPDSEIYEIEHIADDNLMECPINPDSYHSTEAIISNNQADISGGNEIIADTLKHMASEEDIIVPTTLVNDPKSSLNLAADELVDISPIKNTGMYHVFHKSHDRKLKIHTLGPIVEETSDVQIETCEALDGATDKDVNVVTDDSQFEEMIIPSLPRTDGPAPDNEFINLINSAFETQTFVDVDPDLEQEVVQSEERVHTIGNEIFDLIKSTFQQPKVVVTDIPSWYQTICYVKTCSVNSSCYSPTCPLRNVVTAVVIVYHNQPLPSKELGASLSHLYSSIYQNEDILQTTASDSDSDYGCYINSCSYESPCYSVTCPLKKISNLVIVNCDIQSEIIIGANADIFAESSPKSTDDSKGLLIHTSENQNEINEQAVQNTVPAICIELLSDPDSKYPPSFHRLTPSDLNESLNEFDKRRCKGKMN